jgi:uridylate kinase
VSARESGRARYVAIITDGNGRWAAKRGLKVMDSTALTLCMDNELPLYVFNMDDEFNIDRIVSGERVGTLVTT